MFQRFMKGATYHNVALTYLTIECWTTEMAKKYVKSRHVERKYVESKYSGE